MLVESHAVESAFLKQMFWRTANLTQVLENAPKDVPEI